MPKKREIFSFVDKYFGYLASLIVLAILLIGISQFVLPIWQDIRGVDVLNVEAKEKQLKDAQVFLTDLRVMRDNYELIDYTDIKRLERLLPRGLNKEQLFLQLQSFGAADGLTVSSLTIKGNETTSDTSRRQASTQVSTSGNTRISQVVIDMTLEGITSYDSFKAFLHEVESYSPILELDTIRYPLSGSSASFSFTSYYLSE